MLEAQLAALAEGVEADLDHVVDLILGLELSVLLIIALNLVFIQNCSGAWVLCNSSLTLLHIWPELICNAASVWSLFVPSCLTFFICAGSVLILNL